MNTKTSICLKVEKLSEEDRQKVLAFLETLPSAAQIRGPRKSAFGLFADRGIGITAEMIDEARKEAWANFPREFPHVENQE